MTHLEYDERDLVRRARQGEDSAFEALVVHNFDSLFRVVNRMTSDPDEADAIVQETFFRFWKALGRYQADRDLFPYLVTIATNLYRDQWRKDRRIDEDGLEPLMETVASERPSPEKQLERAELLDTLADAVSDLPAHYRTVIALRYDGGLSYQQIADALEMPVNTIRTHLRRAKNTLQRYFQQENISI